MNIDLIFQWKSKTDSIIKTVSKISGFSKWRYILEREEKVLCKRKLEKLFQVIWTGKYKRSVFGIIKFWLPHKEECCTSNLSFHPHLQVGDTLCPWNVHVFHKRSRCAAVTKSYWHLHGDITKTLSQVCFCRAEQECTCRGPDPCRPTNVIACTTKWSTGYFSFEV